MRFDDIKKFRNEDGYIVLDEINRRVPKQEELQGKNKKNWMLFEDRKALFKEIPEESFADYMELLIAELMKQAGLEAAEYDLAILNGKKGVITPDFTRENERLIHGKDFLESALNLEDVDEREVRCNNIEDIENALILWGVPENKKSKMIQTLATQFCVDCITLQPDRHWKNWGIIIKNGHVDRISPHYDAGYAMKCESKGKKIKGYFQRAKSIKNPDAKRRFFEEEIISKNWKSITLRYAKSNSTYGMKLYKEAIEHNSEFFKEIGEKIRKLNPEEAIKNVESNISAHINPDCVNWFRTVTEHNIREMEEMINAKDNSINVERY